jgi:hypothetical protein
MLEFLSQDARCVAFQPEDNLANGEMLRAIKKQMNVVRLDSQMHDRDIDLRSFFPQRGDQSLG